MVFIQKKDTEKRENGEIIDGESKHFAASIPEGAQEFTDNALNCFGWKDVKTEKWLIKCARIWYGIMSFFWFICGAMTFAPVIFIGNKVNVIFKSKKLSLLIGFGIYAIILFIVIMLIIMRIS